MMAVDASHSRLLRWLEAPFSAEDPRRSLQRWKVKSLRHQIAQSPQRQSRRSENSMPENLLQACFQNIKTFYVPKKDDIVPPSADLGKTTGLMLHCKTKDATDTIVLRNIKILKDILTKPYFVVSGFCYPNIFCWVIFVPCSICLFFPKVFPPHEFQL